MRMRSGIQPYPALLIVLAGVLPLPAQGQVSDARLSWFVVRDQPLLRVGMVEGDPGYLLEMINGAVRLADGSVAILDCGARVGRIFDASGIHVSTFGGAGQGPGEWRFPVRLFRTRADSLVVVDRIQSRTLVYSSSGVFARGFRLLYPDHAERLEPLGAFADGSFLAFKRIPPEPRSGSISRGSQQLLRLSADGETATNLVTLPGGERVGNATFPFYRQLSVAASSDRIFVGTQDTTLIRVLDPSGEPIGEFHGIAVNQAPTDSLVAAWIDYWVARRSPDQAAQPRPSEPWAPWPDRLPAYADFIVSATEPPDLWVQDGFRGELEPSSWTVYGSNGNPKHRVRLPARFVPLDVGDDWVLGLEYQELDVQQVVMYRLRRATSGEINSLPEAWPRVTMAGCLVWR